MGTKKCDLPPLLQLYNTMIRKHINFTDYILKAYHVYLKKLYFTYENNPLSEKNKILRLL